MNELVEVILQRDAYRYWAGFMLAHATIGIKVTKALVEQHLRGLKNGDPIENLPSNVSVAHWDEENFQRFPFYEAAALEIIKRLEAYEKSGRIQDLAFDG